MTGEVTAKTKPSVWLSLLVDYGPVLLFFLSYRYWRPEDSKDAIAEVLAVTKSTTAFMLATVIALAFSKWKFGKIAPMLWLTTILVIGFGLLTVLTQDPFWISHKPTFVYLMFAVMLFGGLLRGKAVLKYLLESAFEGLSDEGWFKLSRNWAVFFVALALLNEVLANREWFTFDQWLAAKLWVFLPMSFIFTFAQMPMLLRHGLALDEGRPEKAESPPE